MLGILGGILNPGCFGGTKIYFLEVCVNDRPCMDCALELTTYLNRINLKTISVSVVVFRIKRRKEEVKKSRRGKKKIKRTQLLLPPFQMLRVCP